LVRRKSKVGGRERGREGGREGGRGGKEGRLYSNHYSSTHLYNCNLPKADGKLWAVGMRIGSRDWAPNPVPL
jgi:hypothetical protein